MSIPDWRQLPESRSLIYAGSVLDPGRTIAITADTDYLGTYAGQCALLVFANLAGRMTRNIALGFENVPMHPRLSFPGGRVRERVRRDLAAADPGGLFPARDTTKSDYVVRIGPGAADLAVLGENWVAYAGPPVIHATAGEHENPFGAMFAAIMAGAQIFIGEFPEDPAPQWVDTLTWRLGDQASDVRFARPDLGRITSVGLGSVGSAALYFLALLGARFGADLIDYDFIQGHNLDRSPIFTFADAMREVLKIASVERFLRQAGYRDIRSDDNPLHVSRLWTERRTGEPDIVISAANEKDVRHFIEAAFPPLQIYATTGRNWQVSLIRHIPIFEACSRCLFPDETTAGQTICSTGALPSAVDPEKQVDAALPFLSFAAGLMTAAELSKLSLPDFPLSGQRVTISFRPKIHIVHSSIACQKECLCSSRSHDIHRQAISGSRYAHLSETQL